MNSEKNTSNKTATIVGAGLVGSLWAVYLSKAGYKVNVYERRADMRDIKLSAGKSINLAMSYRGWKALNDIGAGDEIRKVSLPMYGRTLHHQDKSIAYQPYGIDDQAIFSVSRGDINKILMNIAEENDQIKFHFNETCIGVNLEKGMTTYQNNITKEVTEVTADAVFATDGAFSAVRYLGMQKRDRFSYSQYFIEDGYKEILLPANEDGTSKLDQKALHIWPRGRFMMIALPNFDASYTCTLFMPYSDHKYCFENLTSKEKINTFFQELFPDFYDLMPNVADSWDEHPLSSMSIIRCFPWYFGKTVLMGDAAHGTVPFYGQGMNSGFEDCSVLWQLMQEHPDDWATIFQKYQTMRKPNGDAVQDLSMHNYIVMRDKVADPDFQLLQKIERRISKLYPSSYFPLYSMVSFTNIEYKTAFEKGKEQEQKIQQLISDKNITHDTDDDSIDTFIHEYLKEKN